MPQTVLSSVLRHHDQLVIVIGLFLLMGCAHDAAP